MTRAGLSLFDRTAVVVEPLLKPENSRKPWLLRAISDRQLPAAPVVARADAGTVRPPIARYRAPATTIPASQLRSAPFMRPESGPCRAGTSPSSSDQPAARPTRNAMMAPQLISPYLLV